MQRPKTAFHCPNFLHEDLRIIDLMLRAKGRTLFFSNILVARFSCLELVAPKVALTPTFGHPRLNGSAGRAGVFS